MSSQIKKQSLQSVHFLRAAASLLVCVFHLYCGNVHLFPDKTWIKEGFSYGYLGVEMFFLLSGFIICYALPANYSYHNWGSFTLKRLIRIEPPYILSIVLVLVLNTLSHKVTGTTNSIDWINILFHFAYLNNFGLGRYVNVVYWTLGIEFQFYIIIALLFPLMRNTKALIFFLSMFLILSCVPVPKTFSIISPFLSIFGLGILTYFFKIEKKISKTVYLISGLIFLIQIYSYLGLPEAIACMISLLILLFWETEHKLIRFFSAISFSLYLTHTNVGGKVINLGLRVAETNLERHILFLLALLISIAFAYIFYLIIEKPAMAWSKKIHYNIGKTS